MYVPSHNFALYTSDVNVCHFNCCTNVLQDFDVSNIHLCEKHDKKHITNNEYINLRHNHFVSLIANIAQYRKNINKSLIEYLNYICDNLWFKNKTWLNIVLMDINSNMNENNKDALIKYYMIINNALF